MSIKFDKPVDVIVIHHGSLVGIRPNTDHAETWIGEYVDPDAQWFGRQLMVEPRYADDILDAMASDGLTLQGL